MKIAVIGQSAFGLEVYKLLRKNGHEIVGVFTIPDKGNREDPLGAQAKKDNVPVFKFPRWRVKNETIPDVLKTYKSVGAELNVMPFCSQFIPMEIIELPKYKSIIYHPSLLPKHRGASAINWTLINGDKLSGFTIFWADDGLDTGPILLQKEVEVDINDTVDTLYTRFMMPEGIKAMGEAVELIAAGNAPKIVQPEEGASYEAHISAKPELAKIDWNQSAEGLHNFIRGCDKVPGAWTLYEEKKLILYGSSLWYGDLPKGTTIAFPELLKPAVVHEGGLLLSGTDGRYVNVRQIVQEDGKMILASKFGQNADTKKDLKLNEEEVEIEDTLKRIWKGILNAEAVALTLDFFKSGAGSMDVARLVEEVKEKVNGLELINEEVYMNSTFGEFVALIITKHRNGGAQEEFKFDAVHMKANGMDISFPHQCFINGEFVDAETGAVYETIDPATETVICKVSKGGKADVNKAVAAAKAAFDDGEWRKMSARERGRLLFKFADLLEAHKEELATIESIDSGAVYTLALKTHIGMSIDTWRYFAGWCDKIQGSTIPINNARPNSNFTFTKREPIGVCGVVTPWNYPMMMVSWKLAACLAAGNTVVLKPAQVTPLTALKLAEISVKAGFPKGVINIIPGPGAEVGEAISNHPSVRKMGFTGSTPIGAQIMKCCAVSNVKKVSLELGGKSPLIIFADCDFDRAIRHAMSSVFFNKGENCIAAGRLFVAESIHDAFVARVVEEAKKMIIGDPLDRSTHHGPQNHKAHLNKLIEFCEIGVKEGAKLVYGGKRVERLGLFFQPTIFTDVSDDMMIAKEESFGPVMIISKFKDDDVDGVLQRANATEFGLASGVFSKDISKVLKVADKLDAGTVFVNCYNKTDVAAPFGGFKQSGFGKDLGQEALNEYLKTKTVTIEY